MHDFAGADITPDVMNRYGFRRRVAMLIQWLAIEASQLRSPGVVRNVMKKSTKTIIALVAMLAFTFSSWLFYSKYRIQRAVENRAAEQATPSR